MKYYAVKNGRSNGVYNNWSDCESQVKGHSNSQFKAFKSQAEANAYMNGSSGSGGSGGSSGRRSSGGSSSSSYTPYSYTSSAPVKIKPINQSSSAKQVNIYTDGASKNNQAAKSGHAKAGYGVYYGPNDSRNYSGRVNGDQTNNRGELHGIRHALKNAAAESKKGNSNHYKIHTDSQYSLDSINKWSSNWEKNGWKTANGSDVQNKDLIQDCRSYIDTIHQNDGRVELSKVKGHSGDPGNDMADRLANEGCHK